MIKAINQNNFANLYLLATPIGNMRDASTRLIETLELVSLLLCEDTRKAGLLLQKLAIKNKPKLIRYDLTNENKMTTKIIALFKDHTNIGLCSDAGTPLICDPGFPLVKQIQEHDINVVSIPGPIAYVNALIVSGFATNNVFLGFLKNKESQIIKQLNNIKQYPFSIVFYVSCYKLLKTLKIAADIFPDQDFFVAKELTKLYETHYRGKASDIIKKLPPSPKGEYVVIINNAL